MFAQVLEPLLNAGDFLLNVSVDVSSCALLKWCHEHGVLYQDTVRILLWVGGFEQDRRCQGLTEIWLGTLWPLCMTGSSETAQAQKTCMFCPCAVWRTTSGIAALFV